MLRFAGIECGRLLLGVAGAALLALALAAHGDSGPFYQALLHRAAACLHGDFGFSQLSGGEAWDELRSHLPVTGVLVAGGAGMALAVGVPLGLMFHFESIRRFAAPPMQIVAALPVFCAGLLLAFGAVHLFGWDLERDRFVLDVDHWRQMAFQRGAVLPIATVGLAGVAAVIFVWRRTAAAEAGASWRGGQKRLGLGVLEIEGVYVLPRLIAGLLAGAGEIVLALLSASVVAERVFAVPGAAELFVKSLALNDWNMAALVLFPFAALFFVVDFFGRMLAGLFIHGEGAP